MADYTLSAKLTADANQFVKGFDKAKASLDNIQSKTATFGKKFTDIGKSFSKVGDKLTRQITVPAIAATSALGGFALFKGFGRLASIDSAQAKLKGLGHDADSVTKIMESANKAVLGTSFGLDEAATTAASAVAAGIQPGKDLTKYLSITGDAAAIAGVSMEDMGSTFNQVQTAQRAYGQDLNKLADRGIPIYQWLADEANTTADGIRDMASDGEVSSEMFLAAIEKNIGGAAQTIGDASFMATIANIGASIGRIGANFLDAGGQGGGFFSTLKPMLVDFKDSLAVVEDKAADLGVKFGEAFNSGVEKIMELKAKFDGLSPAMQGVILKGVAIGAAVAVGIGPALKIVGSLMTGFGSLVSIASLLLSPIGLIITGIVALAAAVGIAMVKSESFREKVFAAFAMVQEIISNVVSVVSPILSQMWEGAKEGVSTFAEGLGGKLLRAFELVSSVVMTVIDVIGQFVSVIIEGFQGAGGEVDNLASLFLGFNPIIKIAMMVLSEFGPQIVAGFQEIMGMAMPILTMLGETLGQLAAAIIPAVMDVISTLIPIFLQLGTTIMEIVMAVLPILLEIFQQIVPVVMSLVETVLGLVSQLLPLVAIIIDALVPVIKVLIDAILNIVTAVAPALIAILQAVIAVFDAIIPVVMAVLTTVVQVVANTISAITPIIAFIAGVISSIISIIAPIVTFIAGIITSIFSVIRPITTFVAGVFNTVFSTVSGVFRSIMTFISGAISTISSVISRLSGTVSGVFNSIWSTISSVMGNVSSKIQGVFNAITNSWQGLKTFVTGVFTGIGNSMETLVSRVKGFVNGVIGGINSAIGLINKIPGVSIGKIPQLARGTDDWMGGFARMNEGGRGELAMLPSGTQVIPHDVSMKYAQEAGKSNARQGQTSTKVVAADKGKSGDLVFNVDGYELARIQGPHIDKMMGNSVDLTNYLQGVR